VDENRRLQNLRIEDYTAQRLIPVVVEELGDLIGQMHQVESFYLALKDLALGRLSHHLIETEVLQENLDILAETIKTHNTQAKLVYPYVHYYYTQGRVASVMHKFRDENTLIIIIHVPLTIEDLEAPMSIFQVHIFPLLSPDNEQYHTILTKTPKFIIYSNQNKYYSAVNARQDLPCTESKSFSCLFKVPDSNLQLHPVTDNSCAMALFSADLQNIKKKCVYHVIFGSLKPAVYQISSDKIFLVNISSIYVHR